MSLQRSHRAEHGFAALVLALLLAAMFFPYVFGNMNLMSGARDDPSVTALGGPNGDPALPPSQLRWKLLDANGSGLIAEPAFPLVHRQIFDEHISPLWNPGVAFGTPLAAEMQEQPFYPLASIVVLAPGPTTFAAYIVLRLFVAGITTYLFLRFFVGFFPALGGGLAFMLTGYFFKYLTMPHLSVETLTGALFLGVEWVLRRSRPWLAVPFLAVVVWFDFLGGMPESTFINIAFAGTYAVFRLATVPAYRAAWIVRARDLAFATTCGAACAAFLLLPFAEMLVRSSNVHEPGKNGGGIPGLIADGRPITSLAAYALPLLFGPPWQAGLPFNDGNFGVVAIFLAVAAIAFAILVPRSGLAVPIAFFGAATAVLIAKRYGLPAVNWIGALPLLRVITFEKYNEAATGFAMAALVGFGLQALFVNPLRRRVIVFSAFVATLVAVQVIDKATLTSINPLLPHAARFFYLAVAGGLISLAAIGVIAALAISRTLRSRGTLCALALLTLTTEMCLNYFVPMYYFVDPGPPKLQNPYVGASYITYLQRKTRSGERVYGDNTPVLEPNWAEAFDLEDPRNIDAIYDGHYLKFVRAFLPKDTHSDLRADFSGSGDYTMTTSLGRKFLSLGAVRYVIAPRTLDPTSLEARIETALATTRTGSQARTIGQFVLGSEPVDGFTQTRSQRVTFPFEVTPQTRAIALALGVPDTFWTLPHGRADFSVAIARGSSDGRDVLVRHFDSRFARKHGWEHAQIDMRAYAGQRVRISFRMSTNGASSAVGYWGGIREETALGEREPFVLERRFDETNLYALQHTLPHGALYENIGLANDSDVLTTLTNPGFDQFRKTIVSRESVPPTLAVAVDDLTRQRASPARAAALERSSANDVSYHTNAAKSALFVLSDTYYPGWKAYVDSIETPIVRADYLFRGVVVPPGNHTVEFRYDPPLFRVGLILCGCSLLALVAFATLSKRAGATASRTRRGAIAEV